MDKTLFVLGILYLSDPVYLQSCLTPDAKEGVCEVLSSCAPIQDYLVSIQVSGKLLTEYARKIIWMYQCGSTTSQKVCCPIDNTSLAINMASDNILPDIDKCGWFREQDKIAGGVDSRKNEFPWMAALGYCDGTNNCVYNCGGTLIHSKYVLTAAHCILSNLHHVRLGTISLEATTNDKVRDIKIKKVIIHPKYEYRKAAPHDLAILQLETEIEENSEIYPICMPKYESMKKNPRRGKIAGWGFTPKLEKAKILQNAKVKIMNKNECEDIQMKYNINLSKDLKVLCTVGMGNICKADSGGPLQTLQVFDTTLRYVLRGIVAFGFSSICEVNAIPAFYTEVGQYVNWIEDVIRNLTEEESNLVV